METSPQAEGNENMLKSGDLQTCSTEHYMQPEANGTLRNGSNLPILQGNMVQGLYPVAHPSLNNSSNMELSLDHFDISFSNQFSDLINDFISVEGGSNTIYGHQLVAGESAGLPQPEDGSRASYSQAEMCIPCCSPQQASLHLSSTENGANAMAYMHVTEVVSAAATQGTLGMLQQSGRLFMVTDYSPEWSYPEVSSKAGSGLKSLQGSRSVSIRQGPVPGFISDTRMHAAVWKAIHLHLPAEPQGRPFHLLVFSGVLIFQG